ncbi:MAG: EAL domain-containing protein [Lachnospiraceae bacterium]|nr:EAL domain-containing protein [Lachnospiraceae bacterium]
MIQCNADGKRDNAVFLFTNIEYEVEAKEKLTFMALNDALTRIPNMRTFSTDVAEMLRTYPKEEFLMISIDIGQFRLVNKLFRYSEGDNVLKYFATKLQEIIESYDKGIYCRMASDIFYACISEKENVEEFLSVLQTGMKNYPLKFELKLYFGIFKITDRMEPVEYMVEHSSYARLEAKKNPLQNIAYYNDELKKKEFFEAVVVSEMEQALQEGQFEVYYQPKCNSLTKQIIGAEALIRWNNPEKGYLSPGIFIPIFEQNGFVTEVDYYVCTQVCKKIREWMDHGVTPVPVSINISRCDLYDKELLSRIMSTVDEYQVPHNLIEFEITESAFILESNLLVSFTKALRKEGFCVLIDDFGSGYSSLNSLKNIDVDVLKIDIAFLPVSTGEKKSPIIMEAVINMAQKLGLDTVAEGVETVEQLELLEKLGCYKIQGYYFYKPMAVTDFEKLLRK